MKDKITGLSIGINRQMSKLDIEKLNEMYPCKQLGPVCGEFYTLCQSLLTLDFFAIC